MKTKNNLILQLTLISLVLNLASLLFTYINASQEEPEKQTLTTIEHEKMSANKIFQHENNEYICNVIFV